MKPITIGMALAILVASNVAAQTPPGTLTYPKAATASYFVGYPMTPDTPQVSGGAPVSYTVNPALPTGLALNSSTGVLSGTPTAVSSGSYTITGSNLAGAAQAVINITVTVKPPSNLSYSRASFDFIVGASIRPDTPQVTGIPASYSVSPALPPGLTLQTAKGILTGTPTAASTAKSYVITASNSSGTTQTTLQIAVQPSALAPVQPEGFTCNDVSFLDRNVGFAVGWYSALSKGGTPTLAIVKTTDGGATWTDAFLSGWPGSTSSFSPDLGTIAVVNATTIYALGISGGTFNVGTGASNTVAAILKSTNGGTSWQWVNHDSLGSLNHLYFASSTLGYISTSRLYKTLDGGASLIPVPAAGSGFTAMTFRDASAGLMAEFNFVAKSATIARTTDGGITWNQSDAGSRHLYALAFPTATVGYAAGDSGTVLKSTDGGASWNSLSTGRATRLTAVSFIGPDTGFVAGDNGVLLRTENGGLSWIPQVNGRTTGLNQLSFPESDVGYACDGAILKYTGSVPVATQGAPHASSPGALRLQGGNRLSFRLEKPATVKIKIVDLEGRVLFSSNEFRAAGTQEFELPGNLGGGLRVVDFQAGLFRESLLLPGR